MIRLLAITAALTMAGVTPGFSQTTAPSPADQGAPLAATQPGGAPSAAPSATMEHGAPTAPPVKRRTLTTIGGVPVRIDTNLGPSNNSNAAYQTLGGQPVSGKDAAALGPLLNAPGQ
ncbi:MAG TPA: hypothetical protein VMI52_00905 [Acetobacteraceae bacterium]|nr:hypothetical protein [Acetobacteraceae bacterium]